MAVNFNVSVRCYNCLRALDITEAQDNLSDLELFEEEDLLKFRNIGLKSLEEIKELMGRFNLKFKKS